MQNQLFTNVHTLFSMFLVLFPVFLYLELQVFSAYDKMQMNQLIMCISATIIISNNALNLDSIQLMKHWM